MPPPIVLYFHSTRKVAEPVVREVLVIVFKATISFLGFVYLLGIAGAYRQGHLKSVSDLALSADAWGAILATTIVFTSVVLLIGLLTVVLRRRARGDGDAKGSKRTGDAWPASPGGKRT